MRHGAVVMGEERENIQITLPEDFKGNVNKSEKEPSLTFNPWPLMGSVASLSRGDESAKPAVLPTDCSSLPLSKHRTEPYSISYKHPLEGTAVAPVISAQSPPPVRYCSPTVSSCGSPEGTWSPGSQATCLATSPRYSLSPTKSTTLPPLADYSTFSLSPPRSRPSCSPSCRTTVSPLSKGQSPCTLGRSCSPPCSDRALGQEIPKPLVSASPPPMQERSPSPVRGFVAPYRPDLRPPPPVLGRHLSNGCSDFWPTSASETEEEISRELSGYLTNGGVLGAGGIRLNGDSGGLASHSFHSMARGRRDTTTDCSQTTPPLSQSRAGSPSSEQSDSQAEATTREARPKCLERREEGHGVVLHTMREGAPSLACTDPARSCGPILRDAAPDLESAVTAPQRSERRPAVQRCLRGPDLLGTRRLRRADIEGSSLSESSSRVDDSSPPRDSPSLESSDSDPELESGEESRDRRQRNGRSSMPDREIDEDDTETAELQVNLRKISGRSFIPSLKLSSEERESDVEDRERKSRSVSAEVVEPGHSASPEGWRPAPRSQEREVAAEREVVEEDTEQAEFQTHLRKLSSNKEPVGVASSEAGDEARAGPPAIPESGEPPAEPEVHRPLGRVEEDNSAAPVQVSRAPPGRRAGKRGMKQQGLQRSRTWQGFSSGQRYESVTDAGLPPPPPPPPPASLPPAKRWVQLCTHLAGGKTAVCHK